MKNLHPLKSLAAFFRGLTQRLTFVLESQDELEVLNHSAAASFAFLLSVVPGLLVSIGLAELIFPWASAQSAGQGWLSNLLGSFSFTGSPMNLTGQGFSVLAALGALAGLYLSAMLFVSTIRKGLRLILGGQARAMTIPQVVVAVATDLGSLFVLVTVLTLSQIGPWIPGFAQISMALPLVALFLFTVATLMFLSPRKPRFLTVLFVSLAIVILFTAATVFLRTMINMNQYEQMYGILAKFIILLLNVYVFFVLYFFGAVFLFVEGNLDSLLFGRLYRISNQPKASPVDLWIFGDKSRLWKRYGRELSPGEFLFHGGDGGQNAYYLLSGGVEILIEKDGQEATKLDTLKPGEIFGETAFLLQENRTASARAAGSTKVLELPPSVFEYYLSSDHQAAQNIIGTLTQRLKKANLRK